MPLLCHNYAFLPLVILIQLLHMAICYNFIILRRNEKRWNLNSM
jgi:hypothetical protein